MNNDNKQIIKERVERTEMYKIACPIFIVDKENKIPIWLDKLEKNKCDITINQTSVIDEQV